MLYVPPDEPPKSPWRSKTLWVNLLTLLVSLLTFLSEQDFVSDQVLIYLTGLALPIVNVVLRFLTNQAVTLPVKDRRLSLLIPLGLALVLPLPAAAQTKPALTLPAEVSGEVGAFVVVAAETNGAEVRWVAITPGLNVFPAQLLRDSRSTVVTAPQAGRYQILAYTALDDLPSDPATAVVVIGDVPDSPPRPPKPPGSPPTPDGWGLAAQVPTWVASVPVSFRGNKAEIAGALRDAAGAAREGKFDALAEMENALAVMLGGAIQNKPAWAEFGNRFMGAVDQLKKAGKITTPREFGAALLEVAGALEEV